MNEEDIRHADAETLAQLDMEVDRLAWERDNGSLYVRWHTFGVSHKTRKAARIFVSLVRRGAPPSRFAVLQNPRTSLSHYRVMWRKPDRSWELIGGADTRKACETIVQRFARRRGNVCRHMSNLHPPTRQYA